MTIKVNTTFAHYEHIRKYGIYIRNECAARDIAAYEAFESGKLLSFDAWREREQKEYMDRKRTRRTEEAKTRMVQNMMTRPLEERLKDVALNELAWTLAAIGIDKRKEEQELAELEVLDDLEHLDIGGWS